MKKILLSVALLATTFAFSQSLDSQNFNSLTVGNLGTDITAATVGQGSFFTESVNGAIPTTSTNASNANFQVVTTGNGTSNGLAIAGPNGNKGSRFMWKDGLPAAWTARTSGNNIIEVEVDVNPGTRGLSKNRFGVTIYSEDYSKTLAGFSVNSATGELFLVAYSTPSGSAVGNYNYSLSAAPGIQLPANTWSRVGVSYNYTTGEVLINSSVFTGGALALPGSAAETAPGEVDFIVSSGTVTGPPPVNNLAPATMTFDNYTVTAVATNTLLGNEKFTALGQDLVSIYPNPAQNVLNLKVDGSASISAVQIVDLNGRQVLAKTFNNVSDAQIDVNELATGMYLINVTSGDQSITKKFMKQ